MDPLVETACEQGAVVEPRDCTATEENETTWQASKDTEPPPQAQEQPPAKRRQSGERPSEPPNGRTGNTTFTPQIKTWREKQSTPLELPTTQGT